MAGMLPGVECARRRRFHQGGSMDYSQNLGTSNHRRRRRSFCLYQDGFQLQHCSHKSLPTPRSVLHSRGEQNNVQGVLARLDAAAREARQRLDEKLRASSASASICTRRSGSFWTRGANETGSKSCDAEQEQEQEHNHDHDHEYWHGGAMRRCLSTPNALTTTSIGMASSSSMNMANRDEACKGLSKCATDALQRHIYKPAKAAPLLKWKWKWNWCHWTKKQTQKQKQQADEECCVCLDKLQKGQMLIQLRCHHSFHSQCLLPWLLAHSHCPYCRCPIANPPPAPAA